MKELQGISINDSFSCLSNWFQECLEYVHISYSLVCIYPEMSRDESWQDMNIPYSLINQGGITIYLLFIGISRENRRFPENFLFCFDFTVNSKYVILFHFESNQNHRKKGKKIRKYLGIRGR